MNHNEIKILVIDDELPIREILSATLRDEGYQVFVAADGVSGLEAIKKIQPDITFLDIWMPGDLDGLQVLAEAQKRQESTEFVMVSGHGTIETAVKSTKLGAWDFIEKPLSTDKVLIAIQNIIELKEERREKQLLLNKLRGSIALIGESEPLKVLKQNVNALALQSTPLFIFGDSGTGKSLTAENIHYMSRRAGRPFVEVNCQSVPEDLIEVELFGAEAQSMPGADRTRRGKCELTEDGTLYISSIELMPESTQLKLAKVIAMKSFTRFGGAQDVGFSARVILSSRNSQALLVPELKTAVGDSILKTAPLNQMSQDIPVLLSYFADHFCRVNGYVKKGISEKATELLKSYSWPGNVRELKNFVERVYILTPSELIDVHDVRFAGLFEANSGGEFSLNSELASFREARAQFEKEYLVKKLSEFSGNISKTAEAIGLERSYLHRKIRTYGIDAKDV